MGVLRQRLIREAVHSLFRRSGDVPPSLRRLVPGIREPGPTTTAVGAADDTVLPHFDGVDPGFEDDADLEPLGDDAGPFNDRAQVVCADQRTGGDLRRHLGILFHGFSPVKKVTQLIPYTNLYATKNPIFKVFSNSLK